jgi:hypothetical protein
MRAFLFSAPPLFLLSDCFERFACAPYRYAPDTLRVRTRYVPWYTLRKQDWKQRPALHHHAQGDLMEFVVIAALIAVSFGVAATWLIATRLPAEWIERGQHEGRYASLSMPTTASSSTSSEIDSRRVQARTDTRRVRRSRFRATAQRSGKAAA